MWLMLLKLFQNRFLGHVFSLKDICNKAAGVYIYFFFSSLFLSSYSNSLVVGQMYITFIQENVNTEENVLFMSFRNGSEDAHI